MVCFTLRLLHLFWFSSLKERWSERGAEATVRAEAEVTTGIKDDGHLPFLLSLPYHFSIEEARKKVMVDNSWILYGPPTPIFKWRAWMITDFSSNLEILYSMMYLFQGPPSWCGFSEGRELLGDFGKRRWVENWELRMRDSGNLAQPNYPGGW